MDTSDFYDTAVKALHALSSCIPTGAEDEQRREHFEAINDLRDFIRAADEEREANNSRDNWRAHIREGERKS